MTIHEVLEQYWGYTEFRPKQEDIIRSVLAGKDTIGLLPTGGGKSITFQVPALCLPGLTIVVTPLISLMKDQVDNLRARNVNAVYLHSGLTRPEAKLAYDRCRLGVAKLLYVSPEKLSRQDFIDQLRLWDISLIVVDEAHCISQWGYDFRPSYLKICELRKVFPKVPVLALTASATPEVVKDIADILKMQSPAIFSKSFTRDNISYIVRRDENKEGRLLQVLEHTQGTAIVYVRSRRRCGELASILNEHGISADFYHAGLAPEEKSEKQDNWKNNKIRVIVATNAFGMGIDKPDVRLVVHYDLPSSLEEYYQEAGRAGRDGLPSFAVVLASKPDKALLTRRLSENFPDKSFIRRCYELLGVFLNVGIGDGYNQVYECSLDVFCTRFKLPAAPTRSALGLLSRSGYIEYQEDAASASRVMIIADKSDFYGLNIDPTTDLVLQCLLRSYSGLFADYVSIVETYIARRCEITPQQVYDSLLILTKMHVLHYIPKRVVPYVYYPTSRELTSDIILPKSVYEDQRKRCEIRLNAIKDFVYDDSLCRNLKLLRYFGEKSDCECGQCDVCRAKNASKPLSDATRQSIKESLLTYLASFPNGLDVCKIAEAYPTMRTAVAEVMREMLEDGELKLLQNVISISKTD
jgi:ATP-dependent DNA helicase RecQ